jgi:ABC-type transport system involved in cytochrome c biogenesis permease component
LRVLGVLTLLATGVGFAFRFPFISTAGGLLFTILHYTLFYSIWILVAAGDGRLHQPGATRRHYGPAVPDSAEADGYRHCQSCRARTSRVTLLIAVLPVLTIPFLIGGISWQLAVMSGAINFSSICWALSAALLASSRSKSGVRALVATMIFAVLGFWAFSQIAGDASWRLSRATIIAPLSQSMHIIGISLLVLLGVIGVSALQIRSNWREGPPPVWVQRTERTFCTPVVMTGFFKRWMRRKLDRNPIGLVATTNLDGPARHMVLVRGDCFHLQRCPDRRRFLPALHHMQATMGWFLMGSIAASVVGSFRRERENGVLELLLVSPMATRKLIGGRLRGIWGQFLPATAILIGVWFYFVRIFHDFEDVPLMLYFLSTYLTLPVIGLYFSLASRSFIGAFWERSRPACWCPPYFRS